MRMKREDLESHRRMVEEHKEQKHEDRLFYGEVANIMKETPTTANRGELEDGGVAPLPVLHMGEPTLEGLPEVCSRCGEPTIIININSYSDCVMCDNYLCPKFREPGYYVPVGTRDLWYEKKRSEKLRSTISGIKKKAVESGHTKKISDLVARLKGG